LTGAQANPKGLADGAARVVRHGATVSAGISGALQVGFVLALLAAFAGMGVTAHDNLLRQGVSTGFGFLFDRTGFDVGASFLPHSPDRPYWWTFLVGLANTIVLSLVCIVLATAAGLALALIGAGKSRILYALTRLYVLVFRNIPLIVQVFFWYHVTRLLPPVRQSLEILGCCYMSNRGVYLPHVGVDITSSTLLAALGGAATAVIAAHLWNAHRGGKLSRAAAVGLAIAGSAIAAIPTARFDLTMPYLQGFNFSDGTQLSPEFMAMVAALVTYNVAFVAEIINSGIRAVPRHQVEAARVIGLSDQRTFFSITIPQAIRIATPPLVNQYISLTKSSSLAIAIGYTDLFSVGVIAINHTGQSINVVAVLMLAYLGLSFSISSLGNLYNRSLVARGRR
jgi:general L-amino acid transport system permease protein